MKNKICLALLALIFSALNSQAQPLSLDISGNVHIKDDSTTTGFLEGNLFAQKNLIFTNQFSSFGYYSDDGLYDNEPHNIVILGGYYSHLDAGVFRSILMGGAGAQINAVDKSIISGNSEVQGATSSLIFGNAFVSDVDRIISMGNGGAYNVSNSLILGDGEASQSGPSIQLGSGMAIGNNYNGGFVISIGNSFSGYGTRSILINSLYGGSPNNSIIVGSAYPDWEDSYRSLSYSFLFGNSSVSPYNASGIFMLGSNTVASNYDDYYNIVDYFPGDTASTIVLFGSTISYRNNTYGMGTNLRLESQYSFTVGRLNKVIPGMEPVPEDHPNYYDYLDYTYAPGNYMYPQETIFTVGNGSGNVRSNAFEIRRNGDAVANGKVIINTPSSDIPMGLFGR